MLKFMHFDKDKMVKIVNNVFNFWLLNWGQDSKNIYQPQPEKNSPKTCMDIPILLEFDDTLTKQVLQVGSVLLLLLLSTKSHHQESYWLISKCHYLMFGLRFLSQAIEIFKMYFPINQMVNLHLICKP